MHPDEINIFKWCVEQYGEDPVDAIWMRPGDRHTFPFTIALVEHYVTSEVFWFVKETDAFIFRLAWGEYIK